MIRFVNAKINLGLSIIRKRVDGYHELETLFYPIGLYNGSPENPEPFCDILEVAETDGPSKITFTGNPIDCPPEKNLVWKAAKAFLQSIGNPESRHFEIILDKHLPDGAGLGGGSADATFTLLGLNDLYGKPLKKEQLVQLAARLGADCPFFVENRPVLATGIGEIMEPYPLDLSGYWMALVKPDVSVSTKEAFAGITPKIPDKSISSILEYPIEKWEEEGLKNDFEESIFALHPQLREIKRELKESGALYAAMSGSGSSIFGIYTTRGQARQALRVFNSKKYLIKL